MRMKKKDFRSKYSISAADSVVYPFIYKIWHDSGDLPDVKLKCIIDFCAYAGVKEGAARTAISRLKRTGALNSPENGKGAYSPNPAFEHRVLQVKNSPVEKGFTVAVFAFSSDKEKERYKIRSILAATGFTMLAQNTYINIRGRKDELLLKINREGLGKNIFVFECEEDLDGNTMARLTEIWKIQERMDYLNGFYADLQEYAVPEGLSGKEAFHMLGYAGTVFTVMFQRTEPPIPEAYLPENYPLKNITDFLLRKQKETIKLTREYFIKANE